MIDYLATETATLLEQAGWQRAGYGLAGSWLMRWYLRMMCICRVQAAMWPCFTGCWPMPVTGLILNLALKWDG